ncbi:MAG: HipA domain-containing protein [Chloroflexota bacterium]
MGDELVVLMGGRVAGILTRERNNLLRFDYDAAYRSDPDATPISIGMPLAVGSHRDVPRYRGVTNVLHGLLPDDDAVIRRWCDHYQVRATSPFFLLGTPVGRDCAGAVSFCPPDELPELLGRGGGITWLSESEIATLLADLRRDRANVLGRDFSGQFSLAGAQAKIALVHDPKTDRWGRPFGTEPTNRILKPAGAEWTDQDLNEHVCLDAAGRAGLVVARSEIRRFDDQEVIVSHRYDRSGSPPGTKRIHQEDLCQAFGIGPDRKYESQGGPSVRAIAMLLRREMPPVDAEAAIQRFADALIWNWLIAGTDAHAKNFSVLLAGPQVRLAPLYDVSSMLPYVGAPSPVDDVVIEERRIRSAMKLGGRDDLVPVTNPWPRVAAELGLDPDQSAERARTLADIAPDAIAAAAAEPSIATLQSPVVRDLVERVAERSVQCKAVLARSS